MRHNHTSTKIRTPTIMPASKIAFFGVTGDTGGHCLAYTLKGGYDCIALARTPSKLTKSLKDKGVSEEALDNHLTIIQGDAKDIEAVKKVLQLNGQVVDTIVSAIGGAPQFQWSLVQPFVLPDPTLCQDAGATILRALQQLKPAKKPTFINVSTTGITPKGTPRDVPLAFLLLYHYFLSSPHADKRVLESRLAEHMQLAESERGIRWYINVKPSLLMDGDGYGLGVVREGTDEKPAVGYTIQRKDVGAWIYGKLLKTDMKSEWLNKSVSITY